MIEGNHLPCLPFPHTPYIPVFRKNLDIEFMLPPTVSGSFLNLLLPLFSSITEKIILTRVKLLKSNDLYFHNYFFKAISKGYKEVHLKGINSSILWKNLLCKIW